MYSDRKQNSAWGKGLGNGKKEGLQCSKRSLLKVIKVHYLDGFKVVHILLHLPICPL